jgi:hypothetical protein
MFDLIKRLEHSIFERIFDRLWIEEKELEMKLNTTQIQRRRVTDQIIDRLVSMIANGKVRPGDKLSA